jgi:tRNA(Arg) A34 adenosine deaminase TadA
MGRAADVEGDLWSRLAPPWRTCLQNSWDYTCRPGEATRFSLTSAAVTDAQGTVLSTGTAHDLSDGTIRIPGPDGAPAREHVLAHAELCALLRLDYSHEAVRTRRCMLWATTEPCPLCVGALVMSNVIAELRIATRDPWAGSTNLFGTSPYLSRQQKKVTIHGPEEDPELELVLVSLKLAGLRVRGGRQHYIDALASMLPAASGIADQLVDAGLIGRWINHNEPIAAVLDHVVGLVGGPPRDGATG